MLLESAPSPYFIFPQLEKDFNFFNACSKLYRNFLQICRLVRYSTSFFWIRDRCFNIVWKVSSWYRFFIKKSGILKNKNLSTWRLKTINNDGNLVENVIVSFHLNWTFFISICRNGDHLSVAWLPLPQYLLDKGGRNTHRHHSWPASGETSSCFVLENWDEI